MTERSAETRRDPWDFTEPGQRVAWPYRKWFRDHIERRTRYGVVRESFDRPLALMVDGERDAGRRGVLERIVKAGETTLMGLLDTMGTEEGAAALARRARVRPEEVKDLLRHIYRRMLPMGAQLRQLVDPEDTATLAHIEKLKQHKLSFSLAYLDRARTRRGRAELARETGVPESVLLDLARRADLTRLWLMSGGMVRISWAVGYKGLAALQKADPDEYYERCVAHYERIKGKPGDFTRANCHSHIARMQRAKLLLEE